MHHVVPWGTMLCGPSLRPPELKSCRIIWCIGQGEHSNENHCDLFGFKGFQRLLSMQFIHIKCSWIFYCAFYKDILHFLNPDTALKNKINNWTKWQIFTWYPRVWFMSLDVGLGMQEERDRMTSNLPNLRLICCVFMDEKKNRGYISFCLWILGIHCWSLCYVFAFPKIIPNQWTKGN